MQYTSVEPGLRADFSASLQTLYQRHAKRIRVRKPAVAIAKLDRIFTATLNISNRRGFGTMTLRDLSAESGMSLGSLYDYIDNKEQLLTMMLEQVVVTIDTMHDHAPDPTGPVHERLTHFLKMHLYLSEAFQPWFFFAYMEARHFNDAGKEAAKQSELRTEKIIIDLLEQGRRESVYVIQDATLSAALIKPLLQDWYLKRWKYRMRRVPVDTYASHMIHFAERALLARPEP